MVHTGMSGSHVERGSEESVEQSRIYQSRCLLIKHTYNGKCIWDAKGDNVT